MRSRRQISVAPLALSLPAYYFRASCLHASIHQSSRSLFHWTSSNGDGACLAWLDVRLFPVLMELVVRLMHRPIRIWNKLQISHKLIIIYHFGMEWKIRKENKSFVATREILTDAGRWPSMAFGCAILLEIVLFWVYMIRSRELCKTKLHYYCQIVST